VPLAILLRDARRVEMPIAIKRISGVSVGLAYGLPYVLMVLSLFDLSFRFEVLHISSTLSVLTGLLVYPAFSTGRLSDGILARDRWFSNPPK
jgi:hypothetical protein